MREEAASTAAAAAAQSLLFDYMPALGVAPDVVSYCLVAAACVRVGDEAAVDDVLAAARRTAGVDKRRGKNRGKKKKKTKNDKKGKKNPKDKLGNEEEEEVEEEEVLRVLWEDEHMAAVHKPAGVLVHPSGSASGGGDKRSDTLVDMLTARYGQDGLSGINGGEALGIVHRLDRPTSGVVLVAKTDKAHALLVAAWYQRRVKKTYLALVEGLPGENRWRRGRSKREERGDQAGEGGIEGGGEGDSHSSGDEPGGDSAAGDTGVCDDVVEPGSTTTMEQPPLSGVVVADADGRPARSSWRVVETFLSGGGGGGGGAGRKKKTPPTAALCCSLVEVKPHTGRKHQVRQHMGLALDAPLIGDPLYRKGKPPRTPEEAESLLSARGAGGGGSVKPGSVFFLHAAALELDHPLTGEKMEVSSDLPPAFDGLLAAMRDKRPLGTE